MKTNFPLYIKVKSGLFYQVETIYSVLELSHNYCTDLMILWQGMFKDEMPEMTPGISNKSHTVYCMYLFCKLGGKQFDISENLTLQFFSSVFG